MSDKNTMTFIEKTTSAEDGSNHLLQQIDPFHYEAPDISSLDAEQVIQGGCTPAPTCGNGGNGTSTAAAAVAGGGISS